MSTAYDRNKGLPGNDPQVQLWWKLGLELETIIGDEWENRARPQDPPYLENVYRLKEDSDGTQANNI